MNNNFKNIAKFCCLLTVVLLFSSFLLNAYSSFSVQYVEKKTENQSHFFSNLLSDDLILEKELLEEKEESSSRNITNWNDLFYFCNYFQSNKFLNVEICNLAFTNQKFNHKKTAIWLDIRHIII